MMYNELGILQLGVLDLGALAIFLLFLFVTELRWPLSFLTNHRHKKDVVDKRLGIEEIPGPLSLPILGTRWIYYVRYKLDKVHEAYMDMFSRYGSVVKEEGLWNVGVVSVKDRGDIEKVLRAGGRYPLRPPTDVTAHYRRSRPDRYTNLGIINEQGETWQRLRSLLTAELVSARTVHGFYDEMVSLGRDFAALLISSSLPDGTVKNFDDFACRMGLESTCTVMLGRRMGFLGQEWGGTAGRLAAAVKDQFCASRDTFFGLPFWKIFPTPAYTKFMASEDTIYDIVSDIVDEAIRQEGEESEIVSSVFRSILEAPGLDIRDKKAGIIDFIAAGIKTLGNTLVFMLYLLAKNPECQEKLFKEIEALSGIEGEAPSLQALKTAPYLRACITESFRVLPTASCVARILEADTVLGGYHLRPGSVILCHTWAACMEECNFANAKEYRPERWLAGGGPCPYLVAPFGVGRRTCPGKRFVHLQLQVILAQLVRQFVIEYDGELNLEFEFLLAPESPVHFRFRERTSQVQ